MDIASRSIAFWNYQVSQEAMYNQMLYKDREQRRSAKENEALQLNGQLKVELATLKEKHSSLMKECELEKKKAVEFGEQLAEKARQIKKLQDVCEKLRRKSLAPTLNEQFRDVQSHMV
ncbi:hypothetical protein O9G_000898 [Rozella allomycis CSF55]|uniref:Uncharacterized protein n=1 Tax=Rozella allomycis (strain CSF55) TaxID=988480 RepID=A0A075ARU5_ROZAC|nr:hypothetical protein O9G_000898 [Rozella allomycis CSF55]|eukprot:EPZ31253.1 hypothetical protein O9G_000898 [Rozella allomycis CSF55]